MVKFSSGEDIFKIQESVFSLILRLSLQTHQPKRINVNKEVKIQYSLERNPLFSITR